MPIQFSAESWVFYAYNFLFYLGLRIAFMFCLVFIASAVSSLLNSARIIKISFHPVAYTSNYQLHSFVSWKFLSGLLEGRVALQAC